MAWKFTVKDRSENKMSKKTMGIHHITAIVGHPQENIDFYAGQQILQDLHMMNLQRQWEKN